MTNYIQNPEPRITNCDIRTIRVNKRKRLLDPRKVAELAASIAELGLLQPIGIRTDGTLIYGYHRLEACKQLGWRKIPAIIVENDDLRAELAEIDENIIRAELTLLERAEQLQRRKEIYEQLYPHTKPEIQRIRKLKQFQNINNNNPTRDETISPRETITTPTFTQDTAQKLGITKRSVQQDIQIATKIPPEIREQLHTTPIANNKTELLAFARLTPTQQQQVAELLTTNNAKTVKDAIRHIKHEEAKQYAQTITDDGLPATIQLYTGDFRDILATLPAESIDAIITDPPYLPEYMHIFEPLAQHSARLLKPHGVIVLMLAHLHLYDYMTELNKYLKYRWICAYYMDGPKATIPASRFNAAWKPLLIYQRYDAYNQRFITSDYFNAANKTEDGITKHYHHWQQSLNGFIEIVQRFTEPNDTVLDPFIGSGTTALACLKLNRQCIGCDIEHTYINTTKQRIREYYELLYPQPITHQKL